MREKSPPISPQTAWLNLAGATLFIGAYMIFIWLVAGTDTAIFAFSTTFMPNAILASIFPIYQPRLPDAYLRIRPWERPLYRVLGVGWVQRLLRTGPCHRISRFSRPVPSDRQDGFAQLRATIARAETAHVLVGAGCMVVIVVQLATGHILGAGWMLLFNILINVYPTLVQRFNRSRLPMRAMRPLHDDTAVTGIR